MPTFNIQELILLRRPVASCEPSFFRSSGFTIVELVLVILVLGILSAVAVARVMSGNAFNAIIVRDQIISLSRTAQQSAMGRADVEMTITPNGGGDTVTITAEYSGGTIESATIELDTVTLSGDINDTDSCETTSGADNITSLTPMTLAYDELGDLEVSGVTGSTGVITSAVRICINNTAAESVCVSPSGFAYAGDCDA